MPANVLLVFAGFNDIVNMKIVDSKQVYAWTIGNWFPETDTSLVPETISVNTTISVNSSSTDGRLL